MRIRCGAWFLVLSLGCAFSAGAQMPARQTAEAFELRDAAAILDVEDGAVKVMMVMPENLRPPQNRKADLKQGDIVLFFNGARIKTLEQFKAAYERLKIGEPLKLGLKRKDRRFIVTLEKLDPESLPKRQVRIVRRADGARPGNENAPSGEMRVFRMAVDDSSSGDLQPVLELSVVLRPAGGKVVVAALLPGGAEQQRFQQGDVLTKLNGAPIRSLAKFVEDFSKIAVGDSVALEFAREGKLRTEKFAKPEAGGRVKIRVDN